VLTLAISLVAAVLAALAATVAAAAPPGATNQKHDGWPEITGMLLINRNDRDRPLDARPGHDPVSGEDPSYSCDGERSSRNCERVRTGASRAMRIRLGLESRNGASRRAAAAGRRSGPGTGRASARTPA
jgi:hypothetical protein